MGPPYEAIWTISMRLHKVLVSARYTMANEENATVGPGGLRGGSHFHDLGGLYPDAPIPSEGGIVLRNAIIDGPDGLPQIMDWVAQGDMIILDLSSIIDNPDRVKKIVEPLIQLVEKQIGGEIFNFSKKRLLVLPPTHTAVTNGV